MRDYAAAMADQDDDFSNPLARKRPLGGQTGVAIFRITPLVSLVLFFLFGFLGHWNWSWMFWLLIPIVGAVVYGPGGRPDR